MPHKPDLVASLSGKADRPIARIVVVHFDGLGWHRQADAVGTVIAMQTYASTFPREEGKKADTPKSESDVFCWVLLYRQGQTRSRWRCGAKTRRVEALADQSPSSRGASCGHADPQEEPAKPQPAQDAAGRHRTAPCRLTGRHSHPNLGAICGDQCVRITVTGAAVAPGGDVRAGGALQRDSGRRENAALQAQTHWALQCSRRKRCAEPADRPVLARAGTGACWWADVTLLLGISSRQARSRCARSAPLATPHRRGDSQHLRGPAARLTPSLPHGHI